MRFKVSYSSYKRKGSKSQNAGSFSTERQSSAKKEKEKETTIVGLDSTDITPTLTTQREIYLKGKCTTDRLMKNNYPASIFDKYIK